MFAGLAEEVGSFLEQFEMDPRRGGELKKMFEVDPRRGGEPYQMLRWGLGLGKWGSGESLFWRKDNFIPKYPLERSRGARQKCLKMIEFDALALQAHIKSFVFG